jgi:uncharacterized cupin superfamily protein
VADWFVVNVADAPAKRHPVGGSWVRFEADDNRFEDYGINVHVIEPGQPNAKYHSESVQEDFLILHGECLAIIDGEERRLRAWDFVHCPAGTAHVFVGAGDGPCAILMVGGRGEDATAHYPFDAAAARYGATAPEVTDEPAEAYADWPNELEDTRLDWPPPSRG